MLKSLIKITLLLVSGCLPVFAFAATPEWLREASRQPAKTYADDVNAVVLWREDETVVSDKGEIIERGKVVYRILRPEGRDYGTFSISFSNETKVNFLRGWSITAKGQEYEAKDKDSFERSLSTFEVYSDAKERILHVSGADVGSVVGFEFERKHRPYVFEDEWDFQYSVPVERSRYTLRLPPGWEMSTHWVNYPERQPTTQGGVYVWELTNIPRIEREYGRPAYHALAGHMIVSFISEKFKAQTYKNWSELGAWHAQIHSGAFDSSAPLQQKVQDLAPAGLPLFERIRRLSRFVQEDIRYAAIEIGIGGFKPHAASEVFAHQYGDCKDKAALLKVMLAQIGVKSYLVPIQTERGVFNDKSPANLGFNHVILAIQLPEAAYKKDLPALYEHPKLGHLLIFDPTHKFVPLGQLPYQEQDNYGLLVTENGGELIHLPLSPPEFNRVTRRATLKLLPDGTLQGEVEEDRSGYFASEARDLKDVSLQDRKKLIEHFLGSNLSSFQVDGFDLENAADIDSDLVLRYKFTASHYAKTAGPLLLLRPRVVGEMAGAFDVTKPRHYAYQFDAPFLRSDSVEIALPDGYKVDELPEPAHAVYPFAEYTSKAENSGNVLKYTRAYKMGATQVPVEKIDQLRKIFSAINLDEKNMAVLKKAN